MAAVYIETSIVSYLRQQPSSQLVTAARQLLTHRWWSNERHKYELVISQYVLDEAAAGDPALAADRLLALSGIPSLPYHAEISRIAMELMTSGILPLTAQIDALHIATVAHHRVEYLLTWNCSHIANARILPQIQNVLRSLGIPVPIICTPEELMSDEFEA